MRITDQSPIASGGPRKTARTGDASPPSIRSGNASNSYSPGSTWVSCNPSRMVMSCFAMRLWVGNSVSPNRSTLGVSMPISTQPRAASMSIVSGCMPAKSLVNVAGSPYEPVRNNTLGVRVSCTCVGRINSPQPTSTRSTSHGPTNRSSGHSSTPRPPWT